MVDLSVPAENAAKQNKLDLKNGETIWKMKSQLKKLGLSIDWDREISCQKILQTSAKIFLWITEKN